MALNPVFNQSALWAVSCNWVILRVAHYWSELLSRSARSWSISGPPADKNTQAHTLNCVTLALTWPLRHESNSFENRHHRLVMRSERPIWKKLIFACHRSTCCSCTVRKKLGSAWGNWTTLQFTKCCSLGILFSSQSLHHENFLKLKSATHENAPFEEKPHIYLVKDALCNCGYRLSLPNNFSRSHGPTSLVTQLKFQEFSGGLMRLQKLFEWVAEGHEISSCNVLHEGENGMLTAHIVLVSLISVCSQLKKTHTGRSRIFNNYSP